MDEYRIFVQDVGENGYSALSDITGAADQAEALRIAGRIRFECAVLVLPHARRDLWPDSKTGLVTAEAVRLGRLRPCGDL